MSNDNPANRIREGVQNAETGEIEYPDDVDHEPQTVKKFSNINKETGEPDNSKRCTRIHKKKPFKIPREYLRNIEEEEVEEDYEKPSSSKKIAGNRIQENEEQTKKLASINMIAEYRIQDKVNEDSEKPSCSKKIAGYNPFDKEAFTRTNHFRRDIVLGFTKSSYLLILIPSLFCFTKFTATLIIICESLLHCFAHYKNRINKNSKIIYRSPLYLLTSKFCCQCCADNESDSIDLLNINDINFKRMTKAVV